jgi:ribonuclease HI
VVGVNDDLAPVPREHLAPLAETTDRVLATYGYDVTAAMDAIDAAVPGIGGLFDPTTSAAELRAALERVLETAAERPSPGEQPGRADPDARAAPEAVVLYVDGSSRGNPGPAGAGAVLMDATETPLARLGRPVGSNTGNNTAEYAALSLGLEQLLARYDPASLEVRIDSMTVIRSVWQGHDPVDAFEPYRRAIDDRLARVPSHDWTHLADSDPNPADALATVGADIAALGPGG